MKKSNIVFNSDLEEYGLRYITKTVQVPTTTEYSIQNQEKLIMAKLFEQFLLFDKIAFKVDRQNLALYFLITKLGINKVEELIDSGIIQLVLWTPVIFAIDGTREANGRIDHSTVLGSPPIMVGSYSPEDSDPERNIDNLLSHSDFHRDRKRIFKKKALKQFVFPDNYIAVKANEIVIEAYKNNRFEKLGLKFEKEPEQLNHLERIRLLDICDDVLETIVLSQKKYKSYGKYSYFNITTSSIKHIESALRVSGNTSEVLKLKNIADIRSLILEGTIPFEKVFDLRYLPAVKKYRKWINGISENSDAKTISEEFINAIGGKDKFIESKSGKFLKTIGMSSLGAGLGALVDGQAGAELGAALGKGLDFSLSLFDIYILDSLLKGWNPNMFIEELEKEIVSKNKD